MNVQFAANCPNQTSLLIAASILALIQRNNESADIATLKGVLLTEEYCVSDDIAAITTLLTDAENVTVEQTSIRIDVTGSTDITKIGVNSSGLLYII